MEEKDRTGKADPSSPERGSLKKPRGRGLLQQKDGKKMKKWLSMLLAAMLFLISNRISC